MTFSASNLEHLKLARYEFVLTAQMDTVLPAFLGSTLRGAFGYEWKAVACQLAPDQRGKCLLEDYCRNPKDCGYAAFFEPSSAPEKKLAARQKDPPRPFIFEPPPIPKPVFGDVPEISLRKNDVLNFGLTIFGRFNDYAPFVFDALALSARRGLGNVRTEFELTAVADGNENISAQKTLPFSLADLVQDRIAQIDTNKPLTLRWLTPLRLQQRSEPQNSFGELVKSLSLRLATLCELYGEARLEYDYAALVESARRVRTVFSRLQQFDCTRYSNRQETTLRQTGWIGEIAFAGEEILDLLPLVVAGEFLHVGKGTSFGLGRYEIV